MKYNIIQERVSYWGLDIDKVEEVYNAKHVGDFCTKRLDGKHYNDIPVTVFYQPNPPELSPEGRPCSNYFGLYYQQKSLMICDAISAFDEPIVGSVAQNGDVIFSSYRHDYKHSPDGTAMIDGGFSGYYRTNGCPTVGLKVVKDKLVVTEIPDGV